MSRRPKPRRMDIAAPPTQAAPKKNVPLGCRVAVIPEERRNAQSADKSACEQLSHKMPLILTVLKVAPMTGPKVNVRLPPIADVRASAALNREFD